MRRLGRIKVIPFLALAVATAMATATSASTPVSGRPRRVAAKATTVPVPARGGGIPDPLAVRAAARAAGLDSLTRVPLPSQPELVNFVNPGPSAQAALGQLGKALFWDMQVGSDGQACASCHFAAGADTRSKNQLDPAVNSGGTVFGQSGVAGSSGFPQFGPNYTLTAADFPFNRELQDTKNVVSSQGVFKADFSGVRPGVATDPGTPAADASDAGTPPPDPLFNLGGVNTRRVEPRNTPTVINAVFNFANFWDGRAHNCFNGMNPFGPLTQNCGTGTASGGAVQVIMNNAGTPTPVDVQVTNSSLASQIDGPPLSPMEMSYVGRTFPDIGRKLLDGTPLALQHVDGADSVLGPLAKPATGLSTTYRALIQAAFQPQFWNYPDTLTGCTVHDATAGAVPCSQIEANFSLFFGLAVQAAEVALVSNQAPFDRFMEGDNTALSANQLRGLLVFINQGTQANPVFSGSGVGNCVSCHSGPEFTSAAFTTLERSTPGTGAGANGAFRTEIVPTAKLVGGKLAVDNTVTALRDRGFANIGVRPTAEDIGRGGSGPSGAPLSFVRQAKAGLPFVKEALPPCGGAGQMACPVGNRDEVDGAFKVPGLRNVELTGPYFHNGGEATLGQVMDFYKSRGNFSVDNVANLDANMVPINLAGGDELNLVDFLLSLTDPRVRNEAGPFDHPQLFPPNGHPGDGTGITCSVTLGTVSQACDARQTVPATGAGGDSAAGRPQLGTFLGLDPSANMLPAVPPPGAAAGAR